MQTEAVYLVLLVNTAGLPSPKASKPTANANLENLTKRSRPSWLYQAAAPWTEPSRTRDRAYIVSPSFLRHTVVS